MTISVPVLQKKNNEFNFEPQDFKSDISSQLFDDKQLRFAYCKQCWQMGLKQDNVLNLSLP